MSITRLIDVARPDSKGTGRQRTGAIRRDGRTRRRPQLEGLEDRKLLTAFAQSANVAFIGGPVMDFTAGGFLPTTGSDFAGFTFTNISPADVNPTNLAKYDTIVLNVASTAMGCDTSVLTTTQKAELVSWVGSGNKLIIYDSECSGHTIDYSWLPYGFTTSNPGAAGAHGTLSIAENDTLASADPASPQFIDAAYLSTQTDAVGDSNVFTSFDSHWCANMVATNTLGVTGPVHTYATYSTDSTHQGLFIYNGLDQDYQGSESNPNGLRKIWLQELQQSFNPVNGLPCATPVTGIKVSPDAATNAIGTTYTATATLQDLLGNPQVGVPVTFTITAGPNMGAMTTISPADGKTDANGHVTFTYVGANAGTDTIVASFVNANMMTITSTPVTATWTVAASPPLSVPKTFYTHFDTTLNAPPKGVLINDTDPDPAHIPLLQAVKVSDPSHGTLTLNPDGSFIYVPNTGFVGNDSFQYQASDGTETGNVATVTLVVEPRLSIQMDPASDKGESNTDQITNLITPTFQGMAEPGSVVQLFVQSAGLPAVQVGQANVGADASWSITSMPLVDASYKVFVEELHPLTPDRGPEMAALDNPVIIDTVGPRVTGFVFDRAHGVFVAIVQDDRSGLNQASLLDPTNYALIKLHTRPRFNMFVTGVSASLPMDLTSPQAVTVQMGNGRRIGIGYYVAEIRSGGLVDRAGNALSGTFNGHFPSGTGQPGGGFGALLVSLSRRPPTPKALTPFAIQRASLHSTFIPLDTAPQPARIKAAITKHVPTLSRVHRASTVASHRLSPARAHVSHNSAIG